MNENQRLDKVWRLLCPIARRPLEWLFKFEHGTYTLDTPSLVVSNHVNNYDPLLMAICFPKNQIHFVASEHLFRIGWVSKLISYLVAPIARRKGSSGFDAAMACLRKIRAGRSVGLFAEGETTWDGVTQRIFPATAMLAKASGGALVTYRLEGGYFTAPRWGKGLRRGRMLGSVVNVYSPQQLKSMTEKEVLEAIERDIYEDAFAKQEEKPVRYCCKKPAECLETALYMCPECKKIGTMKSKGDLLRCECGFEVRLTEYGLFEPAKPFVNIMEWDRWQHEQLIAGDYPHDDKLFSDDGLELKEILEGHQVQPIARGKLTAYEDCIEFAGQRYAYADISDMALVLKRKLLFTWLDRYFELRSDEPACLRKYPAVWQHAKEK